MRASITLAVARLVASLSMSNRARSRTIAQSTACAAINVILRFPKSYCMVVAMMVVVVTVVLVVVAAYEMRILTLERAITKLKEVSKT
jgi:hypothetical protein